jgi:hypothetical protein
MRFHFADGPGIQRQMAADPMQMEAAPSENGRRPFEK